jgi:hypothetical protein
LVRDQPAFHRPGGSAAAHPGPGYPWRQAPWHTAVRPSTALLDRENPLRATLGHGLVVYVADHGLGTAAFPLSPHPWIIPARVPPTLKATGASEECMAFRPFR